MGGRVRGLNVLLLTTTGRKTGKPWTTAVGYIREGGSYVVVASNAGSDRHPGWYLNLQKNAAARIQVGTQVVNVDAETTHGDKRQQLWSKFVAASPGYTTYQTHTSREIPVVLLTPA